MRIGIIAVLILIIGGLYFYFPKSSSEPRFLDYTDRNTVEVILSDDGFEPDLFTIKKGTTVIFKTVRDKQYWPASNIHPSHDIYSDFDPKRPLEPDESWSFTFENVGEWGFHDHIRSYFVGKIKVIE